MDGTDDGGPHEPLAPPPAAPPPPPPPTPPSGGDRKPGDDDDDDGREGRAKKKKKKRPKKREPGNGSTTSAAGAPRVSRSYQRGDSLGAAARPAIEHYGDDDDGGEDGFNGGGPNGDASSNPNRGLSNSAEGGGTTLPELVRRMRALNLILCTLALGLEVPSFVWGGLLRSPARLVLGLYLAWFAGLLCCFELHVPPAARFLRSNFGLLYAPGGRAALLFLMGGLCLGQGSAWEYALGGVMVANGIYTLYLPWRYPAFEGAHEDWGRESIVSVAAKTAERRGYSWATPGLSWGGGGGEERERLVGN